MDADTRIWYYARHQLPVRENPDTRQYAIGTSSHSLGATTGDASELVERLFEAQFEQGENVGDRMVLANVATACGYDQANVLKYLDSDEDISLIQALEQEARIWGVNSVPTFIFDRRSGIQCAEVSMVLANEIKQLLAATDN